MNETASAVTPALRHHALNTLTLVLMKVLPRWQKQYAAEEKFMEVICALHAETVNYNNSAEVNFVSDNIEEIAYVK